MIKGWFQYWDFPPLHCAIRPDIDSIQRSYRDLPITSLPPPSSPPHFLLIFSSLPSHFLLTSSSIFPQFLLTFRLSRISSVDWCFTRTPAGCLLLAGLLADGLPLVAGPWSPGFQARRGLWPRPLHRYHMLQWLDILDLRVCHQDKTFLLKELKWNNGLFWRYSG